MNWSTFQIALSPQCAEVFQKTSLSKIGASLKIDNETLDLGFMLDGDILPAGAIDHPLLSGATIRRLGDTIEIDGMLFLISPEQKDPAACYPEPILVTDDSPINLPPQFPPAPEQQEDQSAD